uniref:CCHC-type domain-containing protein n=1 Tax=Mastacembelus armatus TaxID=205130 RepID=A0A3Q3RPL6_9TELE
MKPSTIQDQLLRCEELGSLFTDGGFHKVSARHAHLEVSLNTQPPATPAPSVQVAPRDPVPEPRLHPPERFSGDSESCGPFLTQCSLRFELQPSAFPTERSKVAYAFLLLTGRALQWAVAKWNRGSAICSSFELFSAELRKLFDRTPTASEAGRALLRLQQGARTVVDYSIDFRTLAARTRWNDVALRDVYYHGLSDNIKDELVTRDLPGSLDELIDLTIRVDQRLRQRDRRAAARQHPGPHRAPSPAPDPAPLQVTRLSPQERQRRLRNNLCIYCGQNGHVLASCPKKPPKQTRTKQQQLGGSW